MNTPCRENEERLVELLYDELPEQEEAVLRSHIQQCPQCQNEYEQYRKVLGGIDEAFHPEAQTGHATSGLLWRLNREIDNLQGARAARTQSKEAMRWFLIAASVLLVAVLSYLVGNYYGQKQASSVHPEGRVDAGTGPWLYRPSNSPSNGNGERR